MNKEYRNYLRDLIKVLNKLNVRIAGQKGLNNTDLVRSFSYRIRTDFSKLQFVALDYIQYVDKGRRAKTRKVPIGNLIAWIRDKNITAPNLTTNQLAYAIQTSIFKNGIKPTNIIEEIETQNTELIVEGLADELEEIILNEVEETFEI